MKKPLIIRSQFISKEVILITVSIRNFERAFVVEFEADYEEVDDIVYDISNIISDYIAEIYNDGQIYFVSDDSFTAFDLIKSELLVGLILNGKVAIHNLELY
ncbi:MAG: hypothetical protein HUJ68_10310 [Clostridia bacterium]|nr:hypothetical protein [Clostridia bacterium]